jgi:hypothetical protein
MKITITPATRSLLGSSYNVESSGIAQLKGKGEMELFRVMK